MEVGGGFNPFYPGQMGPGGMGPGDVLPAAMNLPWNWNQPAFVRSFVEQYGSIDAYFDWLSAQGVGDDFVNGQRALYGQAPRSEVGPITDANRMQFGAIKRDLGFNNAMEPRRVRRDFHLPQDLLQAQIQLQRQKIQTMEQGAQANLDYGPNLARQLFSSGI